MKTLEEKVRWIFVEHLGVEENEVTDSALIVEDLGADSLDEVELEIAIEEAFDVDINDDEAMKVNTVGDAIAFVRRLLKLRPEACPHCNGTGTQYVATKSADGG